MKTLTVVLLALLFSLVNNAYADLIVNGSFEDGPVVGSFLEIPQGSTAITGWKVINGNIDLVGSFWPASHGSKSLDLHGSLGPSSGGVSQTFATTVGTSYLVTFDFAGNPEFQQVRNMRVQAAGQSVDFSFNTTGHSFSDLGWVSKNWQFQAVGSETTLQFFSLNNSDTTGPTLDNVSVTAAPEPSACVLTFIGFAAMALQTRIKKRNQLTLNNVIAERCLVKLR